MSSCRKGKITSNGLSRTVVFLLATYGFFLFTGCATDSKKPSAVLSQTTDLRKVLLAMTKAYEQKDKETFFSKLDSEFRPLALFRNQVNRDFEGFSEAEVQVTIDLIRIERESIETVIRWKGDWTLPQGAAPLRKRGHAVFRWTSKEDPHLLEIKGNPPFGVF